MIKEKHGMSYSPLIIFVMIVIIVGMFVFYNYFTLENRGPPTIKVMPNSYNFGEIPYKEVKHTFAVKNIGGSPLEIVGISTSCGCTKGSIESETIPPGQETTLLVTFDPRLMEEKITGAVLRTVYIKSNDPAQPEAEIEITANIEE